MKFRLGVAALAAAILLPTAAWATDLQLATHMTDPLLGLSYDPGLVRFEPFKAGDAVRRVLGERPRWLFASARDKGGVVYIVSGLHPGRVDDGEAVLEADFGTVLRVRGKRVEVLGAPDYLFSAKPVLSAAVIDSLMKDAAVRYERAFNGAAKLNRAVRAQGVAQNQYPAVVTRHMGEVGVDLQLPMQAALAGPDLK